MIKNRGFAFVYFNRINGTQILKNTFRDKFKKHIKDTIAKNKK